MKPKKPGRLTRANGLYDLKFGAVNPDVPEPVEEIDLDDIPEIRNLRHPPKLIEEIGE